MSKKKKTKKKKKQQYGWITLIKTVAFCLPVLLYITIVMFIFPTPNSGFIVMGGVGTLFLGVGLVNLIGLVNDMYFGHIVTAGLMGIGSLMLIPSLVILYTPSIYARFDEQYVTQYVIIWAALLVVAIWYMFFRAGMTRRIRDHGCSNTRKNELLQGWKNYWWYTAVHKEMHLGGIYYLNKIFTVVFVVLAGIQFLLGWWKIACPLTTVGTCFLCVCTAALYGMVSVFKEGSFEDDASGVVLGVLFPLGAAYAVMANFLRIV